MNSPNQPAQRSVDAGSDNDRRSADDVDPDMQAEAISRRMADAPVPQAADDQVKAMSENRAGARADVASDDPTVRAMSNEFELAQKAHSDDPMTDSMNERRIEAMQDDRAEQIEKPGKTAREADEGKA